MLSSLSIHNFAIIEDLDVSFPKGMSILTGETGAGKSILIDALTLLLGERSSFEKIRVGAQKATIEGEFIIEHPTTLAILKETYGEDLINDENIVISRILDTNGRSTLRVNGLVFPLKGVKEMMNMIIDIHSQNQNLVLLDEKSHLSLLDAFIGKNEIYEAYLRAYQSYKQEKKKEEELASFVLDESEIQDLKEQIEELDAAHIEVGEIEQLLVEKERLMSSQKILDACASFLSLAESENGILTQLYLAKKELEKSGDDHLMSLGEQTSDLYYAFQDLVSSVQNEQDSFDGSSLSLEQIDDRIYFLRRLEKKYGGAEEDLLSIKKDLEEKLYQVEHHERLYQEQVQKVNLAKRDLLEKGKALTALRKEKGTLLEKKVTEEMHELVLENATFSIQFEESKESNSGFDKVRFLLSTNKGSPLMPLKLVASGGETSRVMLALKSVFLRYSAVETIIFDEVDTGISGRVAMQVARKMKEMSSFVQVIAISHLPQVASCASYHFYVEKKVENDTTTSSVRLLTNEERVEEIAKMLSGDIVTSTSLEMAKELIKEANS